jgi:NAD(P)-dependent dehydrogenase (short-subunit alcohol dehydrogenase family)
LAEKKSKPVWRRGRHDSWPMWVATPLPYPFTTPHGFHPNTLTVSEGWRNYASRTEYGGICVADVSNEMEGSHQIKTVIITGANVGIGFATAKFLAALPDWRVVLACRNELKANAAIAAIRQRHLDSQVDFAPLDLFSLSSVRRFPGALAKLFIPPIGGLILNAGGFNKNAKSLEFTEDGFERTFQLNFLGHFLLTNLLLREMAAPARIVFVSTDLHDPAATKMGKIMPPRYGPVEELARGTGIAAKLKPMARYGTAKMYAVMTANELDRKLRETKKWITVNSWSPGVVPTTQAGTGVNPILRKLIMSRRFGRPHGIFHRSMAQATDISIPARYKNEGGSLLVTCKTDCCVCLFRGRIAIGTSAERPCCDRQRDPHWVLFGARGAIAHTGDRYRCRREGLLAESVSGSLQKPLQ